MTRRRFRGIPANRPEWDKHLAGVLATFDGTCATCSEPIIAHGSRVVKRHEAWIHIQCSSGWDQ